MDRTVLLSRRFVPLLVLAIVAGTGCQTVRTPEEKIAKSNIPREFTKVTLPEYVVEPPDLILVEVLEALPGRQITGERLVRPDGKISLGFYGEVYVAGLTIPQIKTKIVLHLREYLTDQALGLVRLNEQTNEFVDVEPEKSDRVFVDVTAYNSKVYYVQGDVASPGRLPITGNETVLDAINYAGGLIPTASTVNIRLVRPAPPGASCEQVLPINMAAIVNAGDSTTNYQLMPGDRIVVYRDPIVRTTVFLDRLAAPFNTVLNSMLQYSFTVRNIKSIDVPINGFDGGGGQNRNANIPTIGPGAR
ncbi:MAG: polysaccharide biosynthesis/export family protein [Isosphaeraceae bacterium]|nr:polysaccharide biosynthesis/export family protein [Isosphaeraceae bacterium]